MTNTMVQMYDLQRQLRGLDARLKVSWFSLQIAGATSSPGDCRKQRLLLQYIVRVLQARTWQGCTLVVMVVDWEYSC